MSHSSQDWVLNLIRRDAEITCSKSPKLERRRIRDSLEVEERPQEAAILPSSSIEHEKTTTAAPGIVAPPLHLVQRSRKTTKIERRARMKMSNYPPELQYPPAPAYSVRDTPAWTKPDTYTPPPLPKPEPVSKKRRFLRISLKPKKKPRPVQRPAPEPGCREPEPERTLNRLRVYPTISGHDHLRPAQSQVPIRKRWPDLLTCFNLRL